MALSTVLPWSRVTPLDIWVDATSRHSKCQAESHLNRGRVDLPKNLGFRLLAGWTRIKPHYPPSVSLISKGHTLQHIKAEIENMRR